LVHSVIEEVEPSSVIFSIFKANPKFILGFFLYLSIILL